MADGEDTVREAEDNSPGWQERPGAWHSALLHSQRRGRQSIGDVGMAFPCTVAAQAAPEGEHLVRDHDIVDAADVLIAMPEGMKEYLRSGTWATVRSTRKRGKRIILVYPDGSQAVEDGWPRGR
jgi:hypothetical protein